MPRTKEQFAELREKKREIIIKTAIKLFARKGYDNTSINDIAKAAKISTGLTYHYFTSKQKILEELINQWLHMADGIFSEFLRHADPFDQMKYGIEAVFYFLESNKELWKLYISFIAQPGILKKVKKMALLNTQEYMKTLEKILSDLGFKNPEVEARFIDVFLDGIWLNYFMAEEDFPLSEMKEFLLQRYSKKGIAKLI